jgi:hypothetical protein
MDRRRLGAAGGYFADDEADYVRGRLKAILINQYASFNSPSGSTSASAPRCSACFILDRRLDGVDLDWMAWGVIFRGGSDRASTSPVWPSKASRRAATPPAGLVHARRRRIRRHDQVGRQARRAAAVVLDVDHPDIGVHLVQGQGGGPGVRAVRLRHVARLARLGSIQ